MRSKRFNVFQDGDDTSLKFSFVDVSFVNIAVNF